jgi:hypothetical protein
MSDGRETRDDSHGPQSSPYRDREVKDVEYKTPKPPWHKSTIWFIFAGASGVIAWVSWNCAYYFHDQLQLSGNAIALGLFSSVASVVTGIIAGFKRWA